MINTILSILIPSLIIIGLVYMTLGNWKDTLQMCAILLIVGVGFSAVFYAIWYSIRYLLGIS